MAWLTVQPLDEVRLWWEGAGGGRLWGEPGQAPISPSPRLSPRLVSLQDDWAAQAPSP